MIVIGLGNPILGDDGVGWRVAQALLALVGEAKEIEVDCLALGGLSLMERLVGYEQAIIVDAICTREAPVGSVSCFPLEELPDLCTGHTTAAHDVSLQTALKVGRAMGATLPEDIMVVAIEAEHVYDFCEALSPPVAAAVPQAVQQVLALLQEPNVAHQLPPSSSAKNQS